MPDLGFMCKQIAWEMPLNGPGSQGGAAQARRAGALAALGGGGAGRRAFHAALSAGYVGDARMR